MKKFLLLLLGVLMALPALARDFNYKYEGQTLTYTVIDEEAKTVSTKKGNMDRPGNNVSGDLVIPATAKDGNVEYNVTSIGDYAFEDCKGLTSVSIPNSVTSIGNYAFGGCSGLTSVSIPNSVTSIGNYAFNWCTGMTEVIIGNSVTSIGESAFNVCSGLTSVNIPNSVTSISDYTFNGCSGMTSVTIGNSVTSIGDYAFKGCSGMTSVSIPNSVTSIGNSAFKGCTGMTEVIIGNSVETIGKSAFEDCKGLTSVSISNSVTSIGESAFYRCTDLTSVIIPNSVTSIDYKAFWGCSGLTSVIIPNSVTSIGRFAFDGCTGLKKSAYPNTLSNPFYNYGIRVAYNPEGAIIEDGWIFGPEKSEIRFAPFSLTGDYVIPNYVTSIGDYAFDGCSSLTSATIGNSVETIGNSAFFDCSGLTEVIIGNSVTEIGVYAFYGCNGLIKTEFASIESLCSISFMGERSNPLYYSHCLYIDGKEVTELEIPNSVTSIGNSAFEGCSSLTSATIGNSVETIGNDAFRGCSGLTEVIIGNSVTEIGDYAFYSCDGLKKSAYPNTVSNPFGKRGICVAYNPEGAIIEDGWIYGPEKSEIRFASISLTGDYVIPNSVTSIGNSAFEDCKGLTSVSIGNAVKSIGMNAFSGCTALNKAEFASIESLCSIEFGDVAANPLTNTHHLHINGEEVTDLAIPESVPSIGNYAFYSCSGLTKVIIGNSVISIGSSAFSGCSGLTEVIIGNSVETIGSAAFYDCSGLTEVIIGNSVTEIGDYAFYSCDGLKKSAYPNTILNPFEKGICVAYNPEGAIIEDGWIYGPEKSEIRFAPYTLTGDYVIPGSVTSIGNSAFCGCSSLTSATIGNSVETIGNDAFCGCSGLTSVTIPNSVTLIGSSAFYGCNGLTSAIIGNAVERISDYAFYGCSSLTSVTIPNSVQTIGYKAFEGCSGLTSVSLLDGNEIEFGTSVFYGTNIKNAYIGRPITVQIFPLSNLETLTIGNTVTEISASVWKNATHLSSLTLGNSLVSIGNNAFNGCKALKEVIVPPSVESIGASAFAGNTAMTSIIMGHNVKTIGEKAFDGCPANTVSITAQTPPTAPNNTFSKYTGKLYLQGQAAVDAYYDAYTCWNRFDSYVMIEPTELKYTGDQAITGKPGDTFQLTATLMPENVTLPQVFWRSTNPEIATVDANGLVTLHADLNEVMTLAEDETNRTCTIIAESLYADGPVLEITVSDISLGIEEIMGDSVIDSEIDLNAPIEVYNLNGLRISTSTDNLAPGIYIIRQDRVVKKVVVK